MSRPLHRGSNGGRFRGDSQEPLDDPHMKVKMENESRSTTDLPYLRIKSPFRFLFPENSSYHRSGPEDGFVSESLSPRSDNSRFKFTLLLIKLSLVAIVFLTVTGSFWWSMSITNSSRGQTYRGYRMLQEQLVLDIKEIRTLSLGPVKIKEMEYCSTKFENFVPCYNVTDNLAMGFSGGEEFDRHCIPEALKNCLVPAPVNYKVPLRWPTGKDNIWLGNVKITAQEVLSSGSLTKRMMVEEEQISFRPATVMYDGIEDYSHQIAEMIGLRNESSFIHAGVRIVLDIGCGYGSFGAHLFSSHLLTMCIADYEASGSQVQLTTERGLPAMIASFNSLQLPYPSLSFDMIHCRNNMDWDKKDGKLMIEVDRLLRPSGYFVLTSPLTQPSPRQKEGQKKWKSVQSFAGDLCWEMLAQQEETVVWKKTSEKDCYSIKKSGVLSLCANGQDVESPYYRPLQACIGGTHSRRWVPITERSTWPSRANLNTKELAIHGLHSDELSEDALNWKSVVNEYWSLLSPLIFSDHPKRPGDEDPSPPFNMLRNILDMNAHFGGFNAALLEAGKSVWVMNVIPPNSPNHLPIIFDRGLVGLLHDWCEPFPSYPRSYDLVHGRGLLSLLFGDQRRCEMINLFSEIDRLLRPEGWIIFSDSANLIETARALTTHLKWDARVIETESDSNEQLLLCQKPFIRKQVS